MLFIYLSVIDFVLICKMFIWQNARAGVEAAKASARAYLESFIYEIEDAYQMTLVTYALTVANSNQRINAFNRMEAMKKSSEYGHFCLQLFKYTFVYKDCL